jgi:SagB-type dehydrogenase family enzyme
VSVIIRTNPAARLNPPSKLTGESWLAENILERRRFKISPHAAAAMVAACEPQCPDEIVKRLAGRCDKPQGYWANLVEGLRDKHLIVTSTAVQEDAGLVWLARLCQEWAQRGWREAAEYHCLCFDYPCIDYNTGTGILIDRSRMIDYQSREADNDRFKLEYLGRPELPLPAPAEDMLPVGARDLWAGDHESHGTVDSENLAKILSLAFAEIGRLMPRTNSAELFRRTSPSGGGRNPSEGYVVAGGVRGIATGWYHVTMRPFGLRRLDGQPTDDDSLRRIFRESVGRATRPVRALIVITSCFERNMYRYREPRTFRTVYMDAGHIAGCISIAAKALGLTAWTCLFDDAQTVEAALGIEGMQEGYMLTVAITDGNGHSGREIARHPQRKGAAR